MADTFNLAAQYSPKVIETVNQETLAAPFITSNVEWLGAKTFHFTDIQVGGFKAHSRTGGWNTGVITSGDNTYVIDHDRDIEFLVDKINIDESNRTASIENILDLFTRQQQAPEMDAQFFSTVATGAIASSLNVADAIAGFTTANVYSKIKTALTKGKLRLYKQRGSLVIYVCSTVMDLLEQSTAFTRKIEMGNVAPNGTGINSRITDIDGIPLVEVIDDERFYTSFDYTTGFAAATGAFKINFLIASLETTKLVPKLSSLYLFMPGEHTKGDGALFQDRALWDTFVFPNGKTGNIDSIYVSADTVAVTE